MYYEPFARGIDSATPLILQSAQQKQQERQNRLGYHQLGWNMANAQAQRYYQAGQNMLTRLTAWQTGQREIDHNRWLAEFDATNKATLAEEQRKLARYIADQEAKTARYVSDGPLRAEIHRLQLALEGRSEGEVEGQPVDIIEGNPDDPIEVTPAGPQDPGTHHSVYGADGTYTDPYGSPPPGQGAVEGQPVSDWDAAWDAALATTRPDLTTRSAMSYAPLPLGFWGYQDLKDTEGNYVLTPDGSREQRRAYFQKGEGGLAVPLTEESHREWLENQPFKTRFYRYWDEQGNTRYMNMLTGEDEVPYTSGQYPVPYGTGKHPHWVALQNAKAAGASPSDVDHFNSMW